MRLAAHIKTDVFFGLDEKEAKEVAKSVLMHKMWHRNKSSDAECKKCIGNELACVLITVCKSGSSFTQN